jgi:hypothetical protein
LQRFFVGSPAKCFHLAVFDSAHEITDGLDLVRDHIRDLEARNPIFYRDHYFEAIKPIGAEIITKARVIRQTIRIDPKMPGYDFANLDGEIAVHGRSSLKNKGEKAKHLRRIGHMKKAASQ